MTLNSSCRGLWWLGLQWVCLRSLSRSWFHFPFGSPQVFNFQLTYMGSLLRICERWSWNCLGYYYSSLTWKLMWLLWFYTKGRVISLLSLFKRSALFDQYYTYNMNIWEWQERDTIIIMQSKMTKQSHHVLQYNWASAENSSLYRVSSSLNKVIARGHDAQQRWKQLQATVAHQVSP